MKNEVDVVIFGLGPMGRLIAKGILRRKGMRIVGAVDVAKDLVGKDLGEILELSGELGVTVSDDAVSTISKLDPDIAVIATTSFLKDIIPQLEICAKSGVDVISTCEELTFPFYKYPQKSEEIDKMAIRNGVTILGTGINPGFLMDTLPILLTTVCERVDSIKVTRMMDSSKRRIPYQKKIGTGLTPEEFMKAMKEKRITGHVGLEESIAMISSSLGWKLDNIEKYPPEPIISSSDVVTPFKRIRAGEVAGLKSVADGLMDGKRVITLEFISHAEVREEYDSVIIEGEPRVEEKIINGVNGDVGTVNVLINMIPKVLDAEPGLVTMKDLPLPSAFTGDLRQYL